MKHNHSGVGRTLERTLLAGILTLTLILFLIPAVSAEDPAMYRGNPQHTGVYSTGEIEPSAIGLWKSPVIDPTGDPVVSGGVVFIGNRTGFLSAFTAKSGMLEWCAAPGSDCGDPPGPAGTLSTPLVYNNMIYYHWLAPGSIERLAILNTGDGRTADGTCGGVWAGGPRDRAMSSPVLVDPAANEVVEGGSDGQIWDCAPGTISSDGIFEADGPVYSSPAFDNNRLYFGDETGQVYAIDATKYTKAPVWKKPTGGPVTSSPAVSGGVVYIGSVDGNLYAFDENDGQERWHYATGSQVIAAPAVNAGLVYTTAGGHLLAINAVDGTLRWSKDLDSELSPSIADGVVYIGTVNGEVLAFNASAGDPLWAYQVMTRDETADSIASSIVIDNGKLFFTTGSGTLVALGVKSAPPFMGWQKAFGGSNLDVGLYIVRTGDNGVLAGGATSSSDGDITSSAFHGIQDIFLVKYSANNDVQWTHTFGGSDGMSDLQHIYILDDGYLISGSTYATKDDVHGHHGPNTNTDIWLLRLDSQGSVLWSRCYGGTGNDLVSSITATPDKDLAVAGHTFSTDGDFQGLRSDPSDADAFVMKIDDSSGLIELTKVYGGSKIDVADQIELSNNNQVYYIAGSTSSNDRDVLNKNHGKDTGTFDGWLFTTDLNGNLLTSECYGGSSNDYFMGLHPLPDGHFILAGSTSSIDGQIPPSKHGSKGSYDAWFLNIDPLGKITGNMCFGGTKDDFATSVRDDVEGNFYFLGSTASNDGDVSFNHGGNSGTFDMWLVKTGADENIIWEKTYGGSGNDLGYRFGTSYHSTSQSNGYIIGVTDSSDGDVEGQHGIEDAWIVEVRKAALQDILWN